MGMAFSKWARTAVVVASAVAAIALMAHAFAPPVVLGVDEAPHALTQALSLGGFDLVPVPSDLGSSSVTPEAAVNSAIAAFNAPRPPVIYKGLLTVRGNHVSDETTPLAIIMRPVYAIALEGLHLMPLGKPGDNLQASAEHTEMVVFVDTQSGKILVATTVR